MTCSEYEDLFAARVEGLLDEAAERQLGAHLADCEACRKSLDETRRLVRRLDEDRRGVGVLSITPLVMDRIVHEQALRLRRFGMMRYVARIGVAAVLLVGLTTGLWLAMPRPHGGRIHAAELSVARRQMEDAKSATWKVSYYQRFTGPAGARSRWFRIQNMGQRNAYKAPGLYRSENLDEDGKAIYVEIEDVGSRAKLVINHKTRTATLTHLAESSYPPRGPFERVLDLEHEDLWPLGTKNVAGRQANGFRYEIRSGLLGESRSVDLWVDAATKRLVQYQQPGGDIIDPAEVVHDRAWTLSSGETIEHQGKVFKFARDGGISQGFITREIALDVELDDALFSLVPPQGYAFKAAEPPPIAEKDVLEFMGLVAEYCHRTFPERLPYFNRSSKEEFERYNRAEQSVRQKSGATPAEIRLVEAIDRWYRTGIPGPGPMHVFITGRIAEGSWKYLGKGVKLGDKDRIVCWYRPKGARAYRVVHGDLSVKDVEPEDLPLAVGR